MAYAKANGHGHIQSCLWASAQAVPLPGAAFCYSPSLLDFSLPQDHLQQISPRRSRLIARPSAHSASPKTGHSRSIHPGPGTLLMLCCEEGDAMEKMITIK